MKNKVNIYLKEKASKITLKSKKNFFKKLNLYLYRAFKVFKQF